MYFLFICRIELRVKKAGGHRSREPSFGEVGHIVPSVVVWACLGLVLHMGLTSLHLGQNCPRKITKTR